MNFKRDDVLKAMHKDNIAFSDLYKDIRLDLYKMAYYIVGNSELAEDIVSDTIVDAYKGIYKLKCEDNFEPWILKILTAKCKRSFKEKYNSFSIFNPKAKAIDSFDIAGANALSDCYELTDIHAALLKLPKEDRIIIYLCVIQGYKSSEVSKVLSMNPNTIRSRLNRALKKMKHDLEV